jgi:hypothetical protein
LPSRTIYSLSRINMMTMVNRLLVLLTEITIVALNNVSIVETDLIMSFGRIQILSANEVKSSLVPLQFQHKRPGNVFPA